MQYLDLGRYDYGAFHPPLARLAMAIGPYLYGARAQKLPDRWKEGNAVLNSAPRYGKALTLARLGILPFFLLACTVVWLWGRKLLGDWGALAPVFLFTNLPPVLAHAGVATMDMAAGAGICTALFTYTFWLEEGSLRRAVLFGIGLALAVLGKFSAVLLLPVASRPSCGCIPGAAEAQLGVDPRRLPPHLGRLPFLLRPHERARRERRRRAGRHLRQDPHALLHALETLPVPAPQLLDGLWQVHNHVDAGHTAYLLGRHSFHGWWYFFPVALGVKTPLGHSAARRSRRLGAARRETAARCGCRPSSAPPSWGSISPPASISACATCCRSTRCWRSPPASAPSGCGGATAAAPCILLVWTAISSAAAHPDYLAYFNELGGTHPERILVDSDLDWGQDMARLATELQRRRVPYFHMVPLHRRRYAPRPARLGQPGTLPAGHRMGRRQPDHAEELRLDGGPTARPSRIWPSPGWMRTSPPAAWGNRFCCTTSRKNSPRQIRPGEWQITLICQKRRKWDMASRATARYKGKIDSAGRVLIPAALREKLGVQPGAWVSITEGRSGRIVLESRRPWRSGTRPACGAPAHLPGTRHFVTRRPDDFRAGVGERGVERFGQPALLQFLHHRRVGAVDAQVAELVGTGWKPWMLRWPVTQGFSGRRASVAAWLTQSSAMWR
jgi:AbrB family looped-hinge helix DNA binding protein